MGRFIRLEFPDIQKPMFPETISQNSMDSLVIDRINQQKSLCLSRRESQRPVDNESKVPHPPHVRKSENGSNTFSDEREKQRLLASGFKPTLPPSPSNVLMGGMWDFATSARQIAAPSGPSFRLAVGMERYPVTEAQPRPILTDFRSSLHTRISRNFKQLNRASEIKLLMSSAK